MRNPLGNLAFGCRADRLRFWDTFWSIKPWRFSILPTVLAETITSCLASITRNLYLDQAGYWRRNLTTAITVSHGVVGCRSFLGRWERSLSPTGPPCWTRRNHRRKVKRCIPKRRAVRDRLAPCFWCQSRIFNLCLVLLVMPSVRSADRAMAAAPGKIDP